mgnify:FL=1
MIDVLIVFGVLIGCFVFTIFGLSGGLHKEKKKQSKGDGGW